MQNTRGDWKSLITKFYSRRNFINYELSTQIVKKLGYQDFYNNPNMTIIDAYSGTAVFSAALNNKLNPKKHILMEPFPSYAKFLRSLESSSIKFVPEDPFRWSSFQKLETEGLYHPEKQPRTHIHNTLLFTANLLHQQGEQLVTQYLNCITNQNWIQRYGRVRLLLWMRSSVAEKLVAGPSQVYRHRLGCQRESCCDVRVVIHQTLNFEKKRFKYDYPPLLNSPMVDVSLNADFTKAMPDVSLIELTPHEHQVEHLDEFEFIIKNLCMLNGTPLKQSLNSLGPGAIEDLGPKLEDILDLKPHQLSLGDFRRITQAFVDWPFKPELLYDFYEPKQIMGLGSES